MRLDGGLYRAHLLTNNSNNHRAAIRCLPAHSECWELNHRLRRRLIQGRPEVTSPTHACNHTQIWRLKKDMQTWWSCIMLLSCLSLTCGFWSPVREQRWGTSLLRLSGWAPYLKESHKKMKKWERSDIYSCQCKASPLHSNHIFRNEENTFILRRKADSQEEGWFLKACFMDRIYEPHNKYTLFGKKDKVKIVLHS